MQVSVKAIKFLKSCSNLASSAIVSSIPRAYRGKMLMHAAAVLNAPDPRKDCDLRSGAVRTIVAGLPGTFPVVEQVMCDFDSNLWYEVHFTLFSALDRVNLTERDQSRVLELIGRYLSNVKSEAGFAAWKAGDLLGDEWRSPRTLDLLKHLAVSAPYVAGRKGALHGLEESLRKVRSKERKKIRLLLRKIASSDSSREVRQSANCILKRAS